MTQFSDNYIISQIYRQIPVSYLQTLYAIIVS